MTQKTEVSVAIGCEGRLLSADKNPQELSDLLRRHFSATFTDLLTATVADLQSPRKSWTIKTIAVWKRCKTTQGQTEFRDHPPLPLRDTCNADSDSPCSAHSILLRVRRLGIIYLCADHHHLHKDGNPIRIKSVVTEVMFFKRTLLIWM